MFKQSKTVLIGDHNQQRFRLLKDILEDEFAMVASNAVTFEQLVKMAGEPDGRHMLIAEGLPYSDLGKASDLGSYIASTGRLAYVASMGCIIGASNHQALLGKCIPHYFVHIPIISGSPREREQIITELCAGGFERAPRPPKLKLDKDIALREQIRSFSPTRDLEEGRKALAFLLRGFFECEETEIHSMGQGLSGAKVFRVSPVNEANDFVLKLTPTNESSKVEQEVIQYQKAQATLRLPPYRSHMPELKEPLRPDQDVPNSVKYGGWYAICYDCLGTKPFGKFMDLETALVAPAEELRKNVQGTPVALKGANAADMEPVRCLTLEKMLGWLCQSWYMNPKRVRRQERPLWQTEDLPDRAFIDLPPYRLPTRRKGHILGFLEGKQARMGARFFAGWENYRKSVEEFVENRKGRTGVGVLDRILPVVLSPAHGDLNGNNIFLWLDHPDQPFLIDFPFYQEAGHALQDLARLEVEIKFALMDRQEDSPKEELLAFDLTPSQLPLWQEVEEHLLLQKWDQPKNDWQAKGYSRNIELCLKLVQMVRRKAREVQGQELGVRKIPEFLGEYLPALLYHTLQAIGWPSLSIFKRLLAVYSAAKILESLRNLP